MRMVGLVCLLCCYRGRSTSMRPVFGERAVSSPDGGVVYFWGGSLALVAAWLVGRRLLASSPNAPRQILTRVAGALVNRWSVGYEGDVLTASFFSHPGSLLSGSTEDQACENDRPQCREGSFLSPAARQRNDLEPPQQQYFPLLDIDLDLAQAQPYP